MISKERLDFMETKRSITQSLDLFPIKRIKTQKTNNFCYRLITLLLKLKNTNTTF